MMGLLLLLVGSIAIVIGFVLPARLPQVFASFVSLLAPIGVFMALFGVILISVPAFLQDPPPPPLERGR